MATSAAKDARTIMDYFAAILVFGVLTLRGRGMCDGAAEPVQLNQNIIENITAIRNFSEPVISIHNNTTKLYPDRYARFLSINGNVAPLKSIDDNEIDEKHDSEQEDPSAPLYGIYYDCLFRLSFQCVQRKLLVFIDRLSRLKSKLFSITTYL